MPDYIQEYDLAMNWDVEEIQMTRGYNNIHALFLESAGLKNININYSTLVSD